MPNHRRIQRQTRRADSWFNYWILTAKWWEPLKHVLCFCCYIARHTQTYTYAPVDLTVLTTWTEYELLVDKVGTSNGKLNPFKFKSLFIKQICYPKHDSSHTKFESGSWDMHCKLWLGTNNPIWMTIKIDFTVNALPHSSALLTIFGAKTAKKRPSAQLNDSKEITKAVKLHTLWHYCSYITLNRVI